MSTVGKYEISFSLLKHAQGPSVAELEPVLFGQSSGSTIDKKLNIKNVPQKFTDDTTCKYWYCR